MKDSGVEWIGEIPEEWDVRRTKTCYSCHKNIVGKDVDNYDRLALTLNGVIKRSKEDTDGLQPTSFDTYQILESGELVFKLIDLENIATSRVGYSPYQGIVSPAYIILHPHACTFARYGEYYFLSLWKREIFNNIGDDGVRSSLNKNDLLNIPYLLTSLNEQHAIVSHLDKECAEIDSLAEKTRESIEEYKKLKQAVITEAVTKGVRGKREMKDSGIEWIGDMPKEWESLRKLSYICSDNISYGVIKLFEPDDENGVKILRCSDVLPGKIVLDNVRTITRELSQEYVRTILSGNEIVINVRGTLGGCAIITPEMKGFNVAREVAVIRTIEDIERKYVMYYLLSDAFVEYRDRYLTGSVYVGLNIEMLSATPILLPSKEEQQEIADYLDKKTAEIDTLIAKKEALLEELETYKKSLIYEYVTGKKRL